MNPHDSIFLETAAKLKESARQNRTLDTAQVKVIGLEDIRLAAGDNWSAMADRVRSNSMMFLEGCLEAGDMVIPAGDGFLVVFAADDGRDPAREADLLRDALNGFYLGQEALTGLRAQVQHKPIEARTLISALGAETPPAQASAPQNHAVFLPVWNVAQEAVTGYWLAPTRADGHARLGYDPVWMRTGAHEACDFLDLDLAILKQAVAETTRCLAAGQRCLIGYTVHASTMNNRTRRQAYLRELMTVPERLRPYFVARIAEIERGVPSVTIAEWVHQLRPVSVRVNLEFHETERAIRGLEGTGAFSASCVLSPAQATPEGRQRYAQLIRAWQPHLKSQGIKFRLDNVIDAEMLSLAASSGVDFLSGETVWPITPQTEGVKPFGRVQFSQAVARLTARKNVLELH